MWWSWSSHTAVGAAGGGLPGLQHDLNGDDSLQQGHHQLLQLRLSPLPHRVPGNLRLSSLSSPPVDRTTNTHAPHTTPARTHTQNAFVVVFVLLLGQWGSISVEPLESRKVVSFANPPDSIFYLFLLFIYYNYLLFVTYLFIYLFIYI